MLLRTSPTVAALASVASLATLAVAGSALVAACSSSPATTSQVASDGGGCQAFVPPSSFSWTSPVYSFTKDVLPIFATSCAISSCHGSTGAPAAGMYLGADGAKTYDDIVGQASTEYPSMVRIKAGDPANSYLLHRIDDDACTLTGCTSQVCAELMPQDGPALEETQLLTIRAWIAQGAVSDVADAGPSTSDAGADADSLTDAGGD